MPRAAPATIALKPERAASTARARSAVEPTSNAAPTTSATPAASAYPAHAKTAESTGSPVAPAMPASSAPRASPASASNDDWRWPPNGQNCQQPSANALGCVMLRRTYSRSSIGASPTPLWAGTRPYSFGRGQFDNAERAQEEIEQIQTCLRQRCRRGMRRCRTCVQHRADVMTFQARGKSWFHRRAAGKTVVPALSGCGTPP